MPLFFKFGEHRAIGLFLIVAAFVCVGGWIPVRSEDAPKPSSTPDASGRLLDFGPGFDVTKLVVKWSEVTLERHG